MNTNNSPDSPVHCSIDKDFMSVSSEIIIKGRAVQSPTKMNTNCARGNLFGYKIFRTCKSWYLFMIFTISEDFIDLNLNDIRVGNWVHASDQSVKNGHRSTDCDCNSLINLQMKNVSYILRESLQPWASTPMCNTGHWFGPGIQHLWSCMSKITKLEYTYLMTKSRR